MKILFNARIIVWFVLGFILIGINAAVSYRNIDKLVSAYDRVSHTEQVLKLLGELLAHTIDAETAQRGYLITGEESYLEPYHTSGSAILIKIETLRTLISDNKAQLDRLAVLQGLIKDRFDALRDNIALRKGTDGLNTAAGVILSGKGKLLMDRIRLHIAETQKVEEVLLAERVAGAKADSMLTIMMLFASTLFSLGLLGAILYIVLRDEAQRRLAMDMQQQLNARLANGLEEVRARNREITLLTQLSNFLQSCTNSQEACAAIARLGPQLFPQESARLYLHHPSRNFLDLAASWGRGHTGGSEEMFSPEDCWALRRGHVHEYDRDANGLLCKHLEARGGELTQCLCVPMMAQGETLGLLCLWPDQPAKPDRKAGTESRLQFVSAVAEQAALALANLKLRETLRQQSIRDALTGLYNRRYLEESLDRELARLERKHMPLTAIMIDVDHFKSFNDTYGHEAGDVVLRDLGRLIRRHSRQSDIACRLGGEEFALLLPETPIDIGRQRAEHLREATRELKLIHDAQPLGEITLSMGLAVFPDHGTDRETLLQAADLALYEAKRGGRNRVALSAAPGNAAPATQH